MSAILAIGVNHESAPIQIREKIAFDPERLPDALRFMRNDMGIKEAAILSTCNRTELYLHTDPERLDSVTRWLSDYHALSHDHLRSHIYHHPDAQAVRHMMRVASGLDSMVLGEPQILGQVKDAYHFANNAGTLGKTLSRLFQKTFSVAKSVRTDTDIGKNAISVAFAAVNLTRQVFGNLKDYQALLIGAGETIELTAKHLHDQQIGNITIANRTLERAHKIADPLGGTASSLSSIERQLEQADVVISSTAAPNLMITKAMVERAQKSRQHRPILFIDLAVPRDIDPQIDTLSDTFLYAVDDLSAIIDENVKSRQSAALLAEKIIEQHTDDFLTWLKNQAQMRHVQKLRLHTKLTTEEMIARAQRQIENGEDPAEILQKFGLSLHQQLMHSPTEFLKQSIEAKDNEAMYRFLDAYPKLDR